MPETFQFLRPAMLWLVPVVILVWWLWQRRSDPLRGWRAQVDATLLKALTDAKSGSASRPWPMLVVWVLAVIALAGPSWQPEPSPFAEDSTALVVLLKADVSMDTPDPAPSRMERAHLLVKDLAKARENQGLGLIAYAGSAHLVLPPTKDTDAVATLAVEISPGIMPTPGDRLNLAIERAARLLEGRDGSLLIIADTVTTSISDLKEAHEKAGRPPTQILAVVTPGSSTESLKAVSRSIGAKLVPMTADDRDIQQVVRNAARPPVSVDADGNSRLRDGGYYLVPLIAGFALMPFRRKTMTSAD